MKLALVWEKCFDVVAPNGWDKLLWSVQERSHIYLDGFRAALDSPVEIPANE